MRLAVKMFNTIWMEYTER